MALRYNPETGEYEYEKYPRTPTTAPDPGPGPGNGPGPGPGNGPGDGPGPGDGGGTSPDIPHYKPYPGPVFGLPDLPNVPDAPFPNLPTWKTPPAFKAPSPEEALNEPGYKFRLGQGLDALQRWAASRGTLNDTGTAKGLMDYGQNSASQEYGNVWNRYLSTYNTNYQTQYVDPYQAEYRRGMDMWKPAFDTWVTRNDFNRLGYTTQADWAKHMNDLGWSDWQNWRNGLIDFGKA